MKAVSILFFSLILAPAGMVAQSQKVIDAHNLHHAIDANDVDRVREIIQAGVNVDYQLNGWNALHSACKTGSMELVRLLLDAGADVNSISDEGEGLTSLQGIVMGSGFKRSPKMIDLLLKNGADPDLSTSNYMCPIFYAIDNEDMKSLNLLLDHGADRNVKDVEGRTPSAYIVKKLTDPSTDAKSKDVLAKMKRKLLH